MRLRSRWLLLFIFLFLATGCQGPAEIPEEAVPTQTLASNSSEIPPATTGYPPPQSTVSSSPSKSYPSSETFLPIAAYPEPTAVVTTRAYPSPSMDVENASGSVIKATDPQIVNLTAGVPTFIEFFNEGCETCVAMIPIIQKLEREYAGEVNFVYLDTKDRRNDRLMRKLNYRYTPQFFLLDGDGEFLDSWIGQVNEAKFLPALNAALAAPDDEK